MNRQILVLKSNNLCKNINTYLWSNNTSRSWWASFALETLGGESTYLLVDQQVQLDFI